MPEETVCPTPKGLPMASTSSPTSTVSLSRSVRAGRLAAPSSFSTARSLCSSANITVASYSRRSFSTTRIFDASPNDMVVRNDDAIWRDDHAGTQRVLDTGRRRAEVLEEFLEERVACERAWPILDNLADIDVHDGRRGLFHDRREGERDLCRGGGNLRTFRQGRGVSENGEGRAAGGASWHPRKGSLRVVWAISRRQGPVALW